MGVPPLSQPLKSPFPLNMSEIAKGCWHNSGVQKKFFWVSPVWALMLPQRCPSGLEVWPHPCCCYHWTPPSEILQAQCWWIWNTCQMPKLEALVPHSAKWEKNTRGYIHSAESPTANLLYLRCSRLMVGLSHWRCGEPNREVVTPDPSADVLRLQGWNSAPVIFAATHHHLREGHLCAQANITVIQSNSI